jgi:XTP/dITP diphosphohydrolase
MLQRLKVGGDMRRSYDLVFASSNKNKYLEAKEILAKFNIRLGFLKFSAIEIQADSIGDIAKQKVTDAYKKCKSSVIVEDDALLIDTLGGFPGPYSSYVFKTIGNAGIINLVKKQRKAHFVSVIAFCDNRKKPVLFEGKTNGRISTKQKGKGWGYDPVFIPQGKNKTYAEMSEKNTISHRYRALKKFARWYSGKRQSNGR